jgi:hypothetical protein
MLWLLRSVDVGEVVSIYVVYGCSYYYSVCIIIISCFRSGILAIRAIRAIRETGLRTPVFSPAPRAADLFTQSCDDVSA